jgi:hypothetical protein
LALALLVLAVASGQAQVPPLPPQNPPMLAPGPPPPPTLPPAPGFVSTYEIVRTLRSAGFDPLAPPLREGTIYVARATDYRGILMRVVLDARTGAIRDANRIVPGPGNFGGPYGGVYGERAYGPYGPGPYGPDSDDEDDAGPYGPGPYGRPGMARLPYGLPQDADAPPAPVVPHPVAGAGVTPLPLPRPRPPEIASRKATDDAKRSAANPTDAKPSLAVDPKPDIKPDPKPPVTTAAPVRPPSPAPQAAPPPTAPANAGKAPSTLTINN